MRSNSFARKIISWYDIHQRSLPWRSSKDPYKIWLSEIILQQTRVAQGLPYYKEFARQYPTIKKLAIASEKDILKTWEGLGYYTRARNLHACAKVVVDNHKGKFPTTYENLLKLPGIGSYTAAAIASMAFGEPRAVLDGNVYRVLSRVYGISDDISSGEGKRVFTEKANKLIDINDPGTFNQALMEFGALQCVPKNPDCGACIFSENCFASKNGLQGALPFSARKVKVTKRYFTYFVFESKGMWAMRSRQSKDIWHGLFDFYLVESSRAIKAEKIVQGNPDFKSILSHIELNSVSKPVKHILTHQKIIAQFIVLKVTSRRAIEPFLKRERLKFYSGKGLASLPKPVLVSRFIEEFMILA